MSKLFTSLFAATILVATTSTLAYAKGGTTGASTVPTVSGPCATEIAFSDSWWTSYYPLPHDNGNVGVNMDSSTGIPRLVSACVAPDWTVDGGNVTGGIQLVFSYKGIKTIEFKYVLGKTDIKYR